ncbi:hypothetical protein [Williamwhitmania taraxaci]|uniref:Carbon monoxide dehydrogenase subunit G n=1 Tax=Williamwhitmania taraxaci TaxID=1640674 RepID=A0A1G6LF92_9BACT|nr:hypothetical protein [Williamwhitmania taraxaci]SDC41256.1 Carbon monoxide dehydrogenase subunit G [Williamwhitmania taraxaci]
MDTYESKVVTIVRNDQEIFDFISKFSNFTPFIPSDKVDSWTATEDTCRIKVKGIETGLKIIEREPFKTIKISGDGAPIDFSLWVQLKQVGEKDTKLKLTIKADLNFMMKALLKNKLTEGLDAMADHIAMVFNKS